MSPPKRSARLRRSSTAARSAELRSARRDRFIVACAAVVVVAVVAALRTSPHVPSSMAWSVPVVGVCLLVVGAAGRALLGQHGEAAGAETARYPWGFLLNWPVVAIAAVVPYLHSLGVSFLSDDFGLLATARAAGSVAEAWYGQLLPQFHRPLFAVFWWLGTRLWGGEPAGYHAASLALHAANALLVFALGARLTGNRYAAFAAGMLFAVQPIHVEPVVWTSCAADLLCTCFCLSSLFFLDVSLTAKSRRERLAAFAFGLVTFVLALVSKEAALALPAAVLAWVLLRGRGPWLRRVARVGAYVTVLSVYLGWRISVFGRFGGYADHGAPGDAFWQMAPVSQITEFLFPLNAGLLKAFGPSWPLYVAACVMAAGAVWWIGGLDRVPSRRLWFYLAFLFVVSAPVWGLSGPTQDLENARFAYLPTIALAWLFGDLCAGRGVQCRKSTAIAALTLLVAAGLTAWYVTAWQQASRAAARVLTAGSGLLADLESRPGFAGLYVQDLPDSLLGAQVFRNCYPAALSPTVKGHPPVWAVSRGSQLSPEVMALSALLPGEYLAAWDERTTSFRVVRQGRRAGGRTRKGVP